MNNSAVVLASPVEVLPPVGPRIAAIIISVILIVAFTWLFVKYHSEKRAVARVMAALIAFVAIFGIDGPALANGDVARLQAAWHSLLSGATGVVSSGLSAVSGSTTPASAVATIYFVLVIAFAAVGIVLYWKKWSLPTLLVMMLFVLPAMAFTEFQGLSVWYVFHVGAPLYHTLAVIPHAVYEGFTAFVHAF